MSDPTHGGGILKTIIFFVLIPLFVFIAGGLAVEYLKPKPEFRGGDAQAPPKTTDKSAPANSSPPAPPGPSARAVAMKELLTRKWYVGEKPKLYGELEVEFTEYGKLVRTHKNAIVSDDVKSYSYEITPEGELYSADLPNLKLVKLTKDELILQWPDHSFDDGLASYKRGWYWWEIALIVGAIVLFIIICVGIKAASERK